MTGISFRVVEQYKDMLYRTALTMTRSHADAEDIMQEVFLKYFRYAPEFASEEHRKAWLLRVTINESRNLLKSFWKSRRTDLDPADFPQKQAGSQKNSGVLQAVLQLPEKYRIAVYLYYYEEYSIKEIAGITGRSEAAVAQHLVRGRNKLRKILEKGEF
ncbi:MAG: RNA polymerase sigma factor [Oscillospiraceae bacterium]|nr:RNA polymerase sigma factor [Oscillospiraceae bacterium]